MAGYGCGVEYMCGRDCAGGLRCRVGDVLVVEVVGQVGSAGWSIAGSC